MSYSFNPQRGLIVIGAELSGPSGSAVLRLALDTGATSTLVSVAMLVAIGCDPALATDRVQVTTGSGVEFAPRIELKKLTALGRERSAFPYSVILCRRAPASMDCWGWTTFADCA